MNINTVPLHRLCFINYHGSSLHILAGSLYPFRNSFREEYAARKSLRVMLFVVLQNDIIWGYSAVLAVVLISEINYDTNPSPTIEI